MEWLTISWSMVAAVNLVLGLFHLFLYVQDPRNKAYLLSLTMALAASANAFCEMVIFKSDSIERYQLMMRIEHVFVAMLIVSMVWFVYVYFKTARAWGAWCITAIWVITLPLNFESEGGLVFQHVDQLETLMTRWGEVYVVGSGPINPWVELANLSVLLIILYVADASLRSWRQGHRQTAVLMGGSIIVFMVLGGVHSILVDKGYVQTPYMISFAYLAIMISFSVQLILAAAKAGRYARQLAYGEKRWRIFLDQLNLCAFRTDASGAIVYLNPYFLETVNPATEDWIGVAIEEKVPQLKSEAESHASAEDNTVFSMKVMSAGEEARDFSWVRASMFDLDRQFDGYLCLGTDITETRRFARENHLHMKEIERLARINQLGELSAMIVHEISQPLTAMMSNASALKKMLMPKIPAGSEEFEVIEDLLRDDRRAVQVIEGMRGLVQEGGLHRAEFDLPAMIEETVNLLSSEFKEGEIECRLECVTEQGQLFAARTELQQVMINLLVNSIQAIEKSGRSSGAIRILVSDSPGAVRVTVEDSGVGFAAGFSEKAFDSFQSQSGKGVGLGLTISRRIVAAHSGRLWIEDSPLGGAALCLELPTGENNEATHGERNAR